MIELSIAIEGFCGLTWHSWKRLVQAVEPWGFAGLYCTDHFTLPGTSGLASLELISALTYLADHTQRLHFGPMVAPFSFRDPVMLTRQAAALDDLSMDVWSWVSVLDGWILNIRCSATTSAIWQHAWHGLPKGWK